MSTWAKLAIVFLAFSICALSVTVIPRAANRRNQQKEQATPVLLKDSQPSRWLLV